MYSIQAVENYDNEMRARLLQFVTGTSKVPMNGFAELQGKSTSIMWRPYNSVHIECCVICTLQGVMVPEGFASNALALPTPSLVLTLGKDKTVFPFLHLV